MPAVTDHPRKLLLAILAALCLPGCLSMPELRVGQRETPEPLTVTPAQREAWRQGADYAARTAAGPVETVYVLDALTSSLGAPVEPSDDPDRIAAALLEAYRRQEADRARLNAFLDRYQGTKLEGTGFNLAAPAGLLAGAAVVAVLVLVPGAASLAFMVGRRGARLAGQTLAATVRAIDDFKAAAPDQRAALNTLLDRHQDAAHKRHVAALKTRLKTASA